MRELLNENTLFATVALYSQDSSSLLLVVEGPHDKLALKDHCAPDLEIMVSPGGREVMLRAAGLASDRNIKGVRFLVDSDYDIFRRNASSKQTNVFYTENHDVFMDIFANDRMLLRRVIDVHYDVVQRRGQREATILQPKDIEESAIYLAACLASVRIAAARIDLPLDFKCFSFGNLKDSEFNVEAMARIVLNRNRCTGDQAELVIEQSIEIMREILLKAVNFIGDHDLFFAVSKILSKQKVSVNAKLLQKSFILSIRCISLNTISWYKEIETWCRLNGRSAFNCQDRTLESV